ncbi:MAG TPA: type II toxin-antitoxin system prevent-host-death family antitoxin [Actinocrinis sp.]|nr:type II toxin-antitoxin system prevent-host-death family antitoxin [Actinocrinis sp.]
MATVTVSELNQQTARVLERVKNGELITITEYGRAIARLVPDAPLTGVPLLDELIAQGAVIPASNPGPIPPTAPREDRDGDINLSELLIRDREEERY